MQRQFTLIIIYMISPSATMYLDNLCRYQCRYLCRNLNRYLWMTDTLLCCTAAGAGLLRRAEAETTNKDNITEVTRSRADLRT